MISHILNKTYSYFKLPLFQTNYKQMKWLNAIWLQFDIWIKETILLINYTNFDLNWLTSALWSISLFRWTRMKLIHLELMQMRSLTNRRAMGNDSKTKGFQLGLLKHRIIILIKSRSYVNIVINHNESKYFHL